ncbi:uncharacterized protein BT62DRAFT_229701 [Guyanagaster necrorhizus]|uniref:Uncharacterized protein n=1 Tax=Guyanagaster necrorhizus TaxID=856835 RepID=A0A9P7VRX2_9AGAR|nr:uncharacterized protein BT62DRAFT_229701 [Guyanagaster necrorhizus MCA 3950]KAG7444839.1 hypothetical protein BT62DRAFT_229701 [Guyanagaster necrorhizus MCA 3950]
MSLNLALSSSSASLRAKPSLCEHRKLSDSHTDCSSSLSGCTSESSTSERVCKVEFACEQVSFQPHSTARNRPDEEMTPLPLSDDDLGDDAEPDERIKSPSLIPTNIYTKKREGRMGFGARRVTAQVRHLFFVFLPGPQPLSSHLGNTFWRSSWSRLRPFVTLLSLRRCYY